MKVAVIAGTPVDTRMGVEYLENKRDLAAPVCEPVYMPVAEDCDAQVKFQYSDDSEKMRVMDGIFDNALSMGIRDFFIYCNSLSGAFDFETYSRAKSQNTGAPVRVYTPLQVYRSIGKRYSRVGVVAANNLSAYNIEKNLMSANPDIYMIGSGNMAIVSAIEQGMEPSEIVRECGLEHMVKYMEACGCEALVLGCTHFPYLRAEFDKMCSIPVIDPADELYSAMISGWRKLGEN